MVWVSRVAGANAERVAATQCPVSLITGESRTAVEEWLVARRLGPRRGLVDEPARDVDARMTLELEREALERQRNGNRED